MTFTNKALRCFLMQLVCALSLWVLPSAHAAMSTSWTGTVTHVTDGDTLWVRPMNGDAPRNIRIVGMDAPEICQPFGAEAKLALANRVLGQYVQVRGHAVDQYGRQLARIHFQGQDVGAWMVSQGLAWSYGQQRHRGGYAAYEAQARQHQLGVFSQAGAEEPRRFRRRFGSCH